MASRRLALMGAAVGPMVFIGGIREPQLRVRGLKHGSVKAWFIAKDGHSRFLLVLSKNGDFPLDGPYSWVQINSTEPSIGLVCEVISKVA